MTYRLATMHPLQTDDGRTDDNHAKDVYVYSLAAARQKVGEKQV